jgi:hypothetical protein
VDAGSHNLHNTNVINVEILGVLGHDVQSRLDDKFGKKIFITILL